MAFPEAELPVLVEIYMDDEGEGCTRRASVAVPPGGVGRYDPDAPPVVLDGPAGAPVQWRDHVGEWAEP